MKKNIEFTNIKKEHLFIIKNWRNQQRDILRQVKLLADNDQKKWFAKIQKDTRQKLFSIINNGVLVGYCGLTNIDASNKRAEVSFLVNPKIAKDKNAYKDYFLVVLRYLTKYGFSILKLNKIFTETFDFRKEHMKILKDFGFKKEAIFKKHYFKRGRWCDAMVHAMFAKQYYGMEK